MRNATLLKDIQVARSCTIRDALARLDRTGHGLLLLVSAQGCFERTVTDGDLRRLMLGNASLESTLTQLPQHASVTLKVGSYTRQQALALMGQHSINHIPVLDEAGCVASLLERKELDEQILLSTPHLGEFEREFVEEAFRTNWIAPLGPHVDAFERELAAEVGVKHAAAVSSGTAAIHLALRLLDVGPGDRVFCSALTFVATANPIVYQRAEPVFIDSEPYSWNMSPLALERALAESKAQGRLPKAVIVVSLYGQSADMDPLLELCDAYGVPVVEDSAESLGASYKQRPSGSMGRLGIFSFNGNKIITTSGGGMLVADDGDLVARARKLATQAREAAAHYEHREVGFNYRMSNVLAGIGRGQLRVLDQRVQRRRQIFAAYSTALAGLPLAWMPEPPACRSTRWLTCFTFEGEGGAAKRDRVMRALERHSIEARPVWKPMHLQPLYAGAPYFTHAPGDDVSARLFDAGLCLPSGSSLTDGELARVIEHLRRAIEPAGDRRAAA